MDRQQPARPSCTRREFLLTASAGAVALGVGAATGTAIAAPGDNPQPASAPKAGAKTGPYNILFILTDQERFFRPGELPADYALPAPRTPEQRGTTFVNHRINSCVCTPSRSVLYTGQHIQQTRMFDNTNFPWITSMSTEIRTVGDMLRDAGYYTAYKGKWHLTKEFETVNKLGTPTKIFTQEMEAYGFSDYFGIGDIIAHTRAAICTTASSPRWERAGCAARAASSRREGKPWFLAVNLVNPHDVMFYNTDAPGTRRCNPARHHARRARPGRSAVCEAMGLRAAREPRAAARRAGPAGRAPRFPALARRAGRPIPNEEARWRRRHNYYLNCLRDVDRNIADACSTSSTRRVSPTDTIVVLTADHGDMDGAHQLHAKGAVAYREQNNVPLIVVHPAYAGGKRMPGRYLARRHRADAASA